ncbi:MAG: STAS domain-containing protein [Fuerstiella sp.]|nr:STAS domain-containing protein [Fuerstiella sp.]
MPISEQRLDIENIGNATVARFLDRKILDETNIELVGRELFALVDSDRRTEIILDFDLVEYLSSAALGKLITMHKKVSTAGGKLLLCNIHKDILEVFQLTRLDQVLTLCTTLDDALAKM